MSATLKPPEPATWGTIAAELRAGFRGRVITPSDAGYDEARRVWNGMIDRRPGAVAYCTGVADVVHAVKVARSHHVPVSVRAGGHNVAGTSVLDHGLVLDLTPMKGAWVDPGRAWARVQAGLLWGDLDRETQLFGLATPGGLISTTGVSGFTLGGGIGWLSRKHGLACDNLVGAEVVTAAGERVRADAHENPELLWALRGAGTNFGVVTSLEFELHPVGPVVYGGALFYPGEKAGALLAWYADWIRRIPEELEALVVLTTAPPLPFLPSAMHGQPIAILAMCHVGAPDAAKAAGDEVRAQMPPAAEHLGPVPYVALQSMFDAGNPPGLLNYWKSQFVRDLGPETVTSILSAHESAVSPMAEIHVQHLGGAMGRSPPGGSAYSHRSHDLLVNVVGKWTDPATTERNIAWARGFWAELREHATGENYLNFLAETSADAVRAAYGASEYARLARLKATYDPENVFRGNHNILPNASPP